MAGVAVLAKGTSRCVIEFLGWLIESVRANRRIGIGRLLLRCRARVWVLAAVANVL
jgi:hypothetical protein